MAVQFQLKESCGASRVSVPAVSVPAGRRGEGAHDGAVDGAHDGATDCAHDGAVEAAHDGAVEAAHGSKGKLRLCSSRSRGLLTGEPRPPSASVDAIRTRPLPRTDPSKVFLRLRLPLPPPLPAPLPPPLPPLPPPPLSAVSTRVSSGLTLHALGELIEACRLNGGAAPLNWPALA